MADKVKRTPAKLSKLVEDFDMEDVCRGSDYDQRTVSISDMNRPALQLVGFYDYFEPKRLQVFGTSEMTFLKAMKLEDLLPRTSTVYWHWLTPGPETLANAATAQVYLTSVNALAETGELINIDGTGNRVSATLFGHEKVNFVIGRNKLAPTYEAAVYRARNVAAPQRARQLGKKTPCAVKADRCYDCRSPERVCRALVTLWGPMLGRETEVLLVDEDLGL